MSQSFEYRFRSPICTPESRGARAPQYRQSTEHGMLIERDLPVKLRDGTEILIDVFRPADGRPAAPLVGWSPFSPQPDHQTCNFALLLMVDQM